MAVFDADGAFRNVRVVDVSDNVKLNVLMDFDHLNGVGMEELYLLDTNIDDQVDFHYITSFLYIELDKSIRCVTGECSGNAGGRTVSWTRLKNNCTGRDDCLDTCYCITRYAAGLEPRSYAYSQDEINLGAQILVVVLVFFVVFGIVHSKTRCPRGGENFDLKLFFQFCLQLCNFITDLLMYLSVYNCWYQESYEGSNKGNYSVFTIMSGTFIAVPWVVNLFFLMNNVHKIGNVVSETTQLIVKSRSKCIHRMILFAVFCCCGSAVATIQVLNCNLLGIKIFEIGLSMHVLSRLSRHHLWLTIVLESIPQLVTILFWCVHYSPRFNLVVYMALASSFMSIVVGTHMYQANAKKKQQTKHI